MNYKELIPKFDIRNPHLDSLAGKSLREIDRIIIGKKKKSESVDYLSRLLSEVIHEGLSPCERKVLSRAVYGSGNLCKNLSPEELFLQIALASKGIKDFHNLPNENQKSLYDFCQNLREEISNYQRRIN